MTAKITISSTIKAPITKVWACYTQPEHIIRWNTASPDWHTTKAENDLMVGGRFCSRMEAKDGSFGFDFEGTYDVVVIQERLDYTLSDGRKVEVVFEEDDQATTIIVHFEPESQNLPEMQQGGWQAILDSFKRYTENQPA